MVVEKRHIAEFNIGTLRYDWDDPRVKDFADNLDRVNAIAARSPGFVWRMPDEDMEAAQLDAGGPLGGDPRTASTLSVWEDMESLERFVWGTVHKQFYDRKLEWYAPSDALRLVLWWVPVGHRPSIGEAMERFRFLDRHGDTDHAFGWAHASDASLWKTAQCDKVA
ncbi:DUF3291 domain-containing protein [Ruegeria sp. 2205SS24-7]|uniref:DUF3291 domain-containing protein n=1 Tax=Ruegeria discodermiae TaxID=3064389 RepID=UPI00274295D2|nr:DUF3291 domain-containing protein [Ruegeria sp. 2205SS24-7]MDP5215632.1 DUF3291 domain-containing protein [Ruegeria sp. 2205SS24-7]